MADDSQPSKLIPFSDYDYFGYLSCGFVIIFAIDLLNGGGLLRADKISLQLGVVLTVCAYILGQITAGLSHSIFERMVVREWLHYPSVNLFTNTKPSWRTRLFPGYYEPFGEGTKICIMRKASGAGAGSPGQDMFNAAYSRVKFSDSAMARLNSFRNLYGFCRNISFTAIALGLVFLMSSCWPPHFLRAEWSLAALAVGIGMFYRYLKFLQLYTRELYLSYIGLQGE